MGASRFIARMVAGLLLTGLVFWAFTTAHTAEPVPWPTPVQDSFLLAPRMEILEDPAGNLTIDQVSSPAWAGRFRHYRGQSINLGVTQSAFWFRFQLDRWGGPQGPRTLILNLGQPFLTFAALYAPAIVRSQSRAWRALRPRDRADRPARQPGRFFHFRLSPAQPAQQTYYLHLQSPVALILTPKISTLEGFNDGLLWRMLLYGALSGAMLGLAFYHLAIFFSIHDRNYLWFALMVFTALIYFMGIGGFFQMSGPIGALLNRHLPNAALGMMFFLRLLFSKSFLPLKKLLPRTERWITGIMMVFPPLSVLAAIEQTRLLAIKAFMLAGLICPVLIIAAAVYCWRKGFKPARYFVFAYMFSGLGALLFVIGSVGRLPLPLSLFHTHQAALCLEAVLLALALGSRIKTLRRKRQAAELAAEEEMRTHQDRLQALLGQLVNSEERQRRRIAENLHDSVTQDLTAGLWRLRNLSGNCPEEQAEELDGICGSLDHSLRDIRSLTFEISPPGLYEYGLSAGLEALASRMAARHGLPVAYQPPPVMPRMDTDLEASLFRMGQELLVNVFKHAKANGAVLSLHARDGKAVLSVEDDGTGFLVSDSQADQVPGFGLFSIRERLRIMGGSLEVHSKPGAGSRVSITVPLTPASTPEQGVSP